MNIEQSVEARLRQIHDLVRSGATEMTGKAKREEAGRVVGRFGGGMSIMYPELSRAGVSPGEAAAAIERGHGRVYERLRLASLKEIEASLPERRKRTSEKPVIAPHSGTKRCKVCHVKHGKSAHRFHGKGSFHKTHLFAFNPPMRKKSPKKLVRIYGHVLRIEAQKVGPHHCDAECKRCDHCYVHDFKRGAVMYGLPDGSLLIKKGR